MTAPRLRFDLSAAATTVSPPRRMRRSTSDGFFDGEAAEPTGGGASPPLAPSSASPYAGLPPSCTRDSLASRSRSCTGVALDVPHPILSLTRARAGTR